MFNRFSIFTTSNTNTSTSNQSSSNTKKDSIPMHDYDSGFKFDVPTYSKPAQKPVNNPTVKKQPAETHYDYERGISMPW